MRAFVFGDEALVKFAGRFVWLSIDTERPENAAFVERYPVDSWPTLLVLDAEAERPAFKWLGSASVADLEALLADGERAVRGGAGDERSAGARLIAADRLLAEGRSAEAARAYREALDLGGPSWAQGPRARVSLATAYAEANQLEPCARVARERAPLLRRDAAFANLVAGGLQCALFAPEPQPAWAKDALAALEPLAGEAVAIPGLLVDDRSSLFELLVEARKRAGDFAGARSLAGRWWTLLAEAAARAPDEAARAAYNPHLVNAAIALGEPMRALPYLRETERALPRDYEAFAREAKLQQALDRPHDALAAIDGAIARAYGPRTIGMLKLRAQLLERLGRRDEARATVEQALALLAANPKAPHAAELGEELRSLRDRLA